MKKLTLLVLLVVACGAEPEKEVAQQTITTPRPDVGECVCPCADCVSIVNVYDGTWNWVGCQFVCKR